MGLAEAMCPYMPALQFHFSPYPVLFLNYINFFFFFFGVLEILHSGFL